MRVLLVDDDFNIRAIIRRILRRRLNVQVEEAGHGLDALERLSQEPFDLVLLDVSMPIMDGMEVLQTLRKDPALREVPVIMITAAAEEQMVRRAVKQGVSDFLVKPIHSEILCERVGRVLQSLDSPDRKAASMRKAFEPLECSDSTPILIVDGSAEFREFFVSAVGALCPVYQATSGLDALKQCLTTRYYGVFIGSNVGVVGEDMLARKIRTLDGFGSVRIIGVKAGNALLDAKNSSLYEAVIERSANHDVFMEGLGSVLHRAPALHPLLRIIPDLKLVGITLGKEALITALGEHVALQVPRSRSIRTGPSAATVLNVGPDEWPLIIRVSTTVRGAERLRRRLIENGSLQATSETPLSMDDALAVPLAAVTEFLSREFEARGVLVSRGEPVQESADAIAAIGRQQSPGDVRIQFSVPTDRLALRIDLTTPDRISARLSECA